MAERMRPSEYYDNPQQFVDEVMSINVRKLETKAEKDLIRKLKRWIKDYWGENGSNYDLYESQYRRLQEMLEKQGLKGE